MEAGEVVITVMKETTWFWRFSPTPFYILQIENSLINDFARRGSNYASF